MSDDKRPLKHDPKLGEVDPRSYPLVCLAAFKCRKIGNHERILQISRLQRVIDTISSRMGDPKARVHFTADPQKDPKDSVEVRLQPLTLPEAEKVPFVTKVAQELRNTKADDDYALTFPG